MDCASVACHGKEGIMKPEVWISMVYFFLVLSIMLVWELILKSSLKRPNVLIMLHCFCHTDCLNQLVKLVYLPWVKLYIENTQ